MKGMTRLAALCLISTTQLVHGAPSVQTITTWGTKCENDPEGQGSPALLAILAPLVVDAVVDHAAASLKAASDAEVRQFPATSSIANFYEINKLGEVTPNTSARCLTIIRGETEKQTVVTPYFRLELGVEPIADSGYFQLVPHYFKADKLEIGNWFSRTGDYSVAVSLYGFGSTTPFASATFNFEKVKQGTEIKYGDYRLISANSDPIKFPADLEDTKAAQEQTAKQVAPYLLALGALKKKKKYDEMVLSQDQAVYLGKPDQYDVKAISAPLTSFCNAEAAYNRGLATKDRSRSEICAITRNAEKRKLDTALSRTDYSADIQSWARSICKNWDGKNACHRRIDGAQDDKSPTGNFIAKTVITETRNANVYGQKLASILGAASDDIKEELKSRLPDARKKAEEQKDTDERKAIYDYSLALSKLKSAQNTYNTATEAEKLDAHIKVVEACYTANEAALAIGQEVPCPQYE